MAEAASAKVLKKVHLFSGLTSAEIAQIAKLCQKRSIKSGEVSVKQGERQDCIHIVEKGRVGVETKLSSAPKNQKDVVLDTLAEGEVYSWSALMKKPATATVRAVERTRLLDIETEALLALCEEDCHVGYVVMKNLASLISSRLNRHRLAMLSAISSFAEGW
jgi:CRP-like cAMP-binding protein